VPDAASRSHHLPRTPPASGLRRQPELYQQAAGVMIRTCTTAPVRKRAMMDEPTLTVPETNIGGYINTGWDSLSNLVGVTAA